MTRYYKSDSKITYDEAEDIVDEYIKRYGDRRATATSRTVVETMEIEDSRHNIYRVSAALMSRCEPIEGSGTGATRYELP